MKTNIMIAGLLLLAAIFAYIVYRMAMPLAVVKVDTPMITQEILKTEREQNEKTEQKMKHIDESDTGVWIENY